MVGWGALCDRSEAKGAGRLRICVTLRVTQLDGSGATHCRAVRGVGVFERSNDHAVGSERSLYAERGVSAFLNPSLSFGLGS